MRFALFILLAAALLIPAAASAIVPTVPNPSFETGVEGWEWQTFNGVQAGFSLEKTNPHSGKQRVVFTNRSGVSPNLYARLVCSVNVVPNTKYELSCWVSGKEVSADSGAFHMTDWNTYTLDLPRGTFDWKKATLVFTTKPDQYSLNVGINIAGKCESLAFDDVSLKPLGGQIQTKNLTGIILLNPKVVGPNAPMPVAVVLRNDSKAAVRIDASVTIAGKKVSFSPKALKMGENKIEWDANTKKAPFGKYNLTVRVLDDAGQVLTTGKTEYEIVNSPIMDDLEKVKLRKQEFDALYKQCKSKGIRLDYPTAAKTTLDQFIDLAIEDVRMGLDWRASYAVTDFNRTLDEAIPMMKAFLADPKLAPVVRRYQTGKVSIKDLSFIGDRVDSFGKKDRGPLFFCGYGHFAQVRKDLPRFPYYGANIIQVEIGPSMVFPTAEDKVDLTTVKEIASVLDNAAKHNMMVNVLLSPHYFPAWAMVKYPHLAKANGGFLGYCVDDPDAKRILEKYLRTVVPILKDKPALHSLCLSNEPVFPNHAGADNTKGLWLDYLKRTHNDIDTLNKRYGTNYASFDEVPYSGDPQAYDWNRFGQDRFARWHKWMADIVHEIAPNVATHAKVMSNEMNPGAVNWNTDQEMFANDLEINGNDCYIFPSGNPDWPVDPWMQNTSLDLQRSFARKPVFDSEHHISPDGSTSYIQPGHFRTALWQGAIHGQGASTIWVWERDFSNRWGFLGNVMDRPGCAQAVGVTCLDLNRFADEVTALETQKAPVAIVYAMSSMIRRGPEHTGASMRAYYTLNHSGVKIDYISEKQLAEGKGKDYKMIIVPEAETLRDDAFEGIKSLPASTRVFVMGECFTRNEYGKQRDPEQIKALKDKSSVLTDGDIEKIIWPQMRKALADAGAASEYSVVDAKSGEPIWGLEWLPAKVGSRTVINMVNYVNTPRNVKILRSGKEVAAYDLFSIGGREKVSTVKVLTPVLAEVK